MKVIIEWYLSEGKSLDRLVDDALLLLSDQAMARVNGNLKRATGLIGLGNKRTMVRYLRSTSKGWYKGRDLGIHKSIERRFTSLVGEYLDQGISVHYLVRDIREKATDMAMHKYKGNLSLASRELNLARDSFSKYLGVGATEWKEKHKKR